MSTFNSQSSPSPDVNDRALAHSEADQVEEAIALIEGRIPVRSEAHLAAMRRLRADGVTHDEVGEILRVRRMSAEVQS